MEHPDHGADGFDPPAPAAEPVDQVDQVDPVDPVDPVDELDQLDSAAVPEPPHTGDQIVDEAAAALAQAMPEPLELQVQAFERAHRTLQDRLADVES